MALLFMSARPAARGVFYIFSQKILVFVLFHDYYKISLCFLHKNPKFGVDIESIAYIMVTTGAFIPVFSAKTTRKKETKK